MEPSGCFEAAGVQDGLSADGLRGTSVVDGVADEEDGVWAEVGREGLEVVGEHVCLGPVRAAASVDPVEEAGDSQPLDFTAQEVFGIQGEEGLAVSEVSHTGQDLLGSRTESRWPGAQEVREVHLSLGPFAVGEGPVHQPGVEAANGQDMLCLVGGEVDGGGLQPFERVVHGVEQVSPVVLESAVPVPDDVDGHRR